MISNRAPRLRGLTLWSLSAILVAISVGAIAGLFVLDRISSSAAGTMVSLEHVEGLAHKISALEWEAIGASGVSPEVAGKFSKARNDFLASVVQLQRLTSSSRAGELAREANFYLYAVDLEFSSLAADRINEAKAIDEEQVDPAFDRLTDILVAQSVQAHERVIRVGWIRSVGSWAILILATFTIIMLLQQRSSALREAAIVRTERRVVQQSHEYTELLLQNSADAILVVGENHIVQYQTASASKLIGRQAQEIEGSFLREFIHPEDVPNIERLLAEAGRGAAQSEPVECRIRRQVGEPVYVEALAASIPTGPFPNGIVVNLRDISSRRRLEEHLRQSQKMEAVGQLAAGIAHDFNNALTVVQGYAELLARDVKNRPDLGERIAQIQQAAQRAADLTRQLLAYSRKQMLVPKIVRLEQIVNGMEKMLRRLIREDIALVIRTELKSDYVKADPGQLEQVLLNLAVNARDAMPEGGTLTIEVTTEELDPLRAWGLTDLKVGEYVVLSVSDTGCGMAPSTLSRIYEPFFTTKPQGKGTGLGLSTVYGIMKQSGGHITARSDVDVGTTFRAYLPRVDGPGTSSPPLIPSITISAIRSDTPPF